MPPEQNVMFQHFYYSSGPIAMLAIAGNVGNAVVNIAADADFQANYMTITVVQAGLVVLNWSGTIVINDSAVGRTFGNIAGAVDGFRGNGQLPYPFNPPRMFKSNTSVTITTVNSVAAVATTVEVIFHGNKIIPM